MGKLVVGFDLASFFRLLFCRSGSKTESKRTLGSCPRLEFRSFQCLKWSCEEKLREILGSYAQGFVVHVVLRRAVVDVRFRLAHIECKFAALR